MSQIPNPGKALLYHARIATPFCSSDGQPCASLPNHLDARTVLPLRSAEFRDWLTYNFCNEFQDGPSLNAYRSAIRTLEANARYGDFPNQKVDRRIAFEGDPYVPSKIILDLATASGDLLEITSRGWQPASNLKHCFLRSPATLPLPQPESPAPISSLRPFLNVASDADFSRCLTWLAASLRPTGPYPILVLTGPSSSGKSFLARVLRALVDPSTIPIHRVPTRDHDLLKLAYENWALIFDPVHRIGPKMCEALCAVSSGDAYEIPQPDSRSPIVLEVARPIVLIAPRDETQRSWTPPRTLANRTITVELQRLAAPKPQAWLCRNLDEIRPAIFATLCDAVSTALRRIRDIDLTNVTRLPDCAAWAAAAAPAFQLDESAIIEPFTTRASIWAGCDPLRDAIYALLEGNPIWTGQATELLNHLRDHVPGVALPNTPKGLSQALDRMPGVHVTRSRDMTKRELIIRRHDASQKIASNQAPQIETTS